MDLDSDTTTSALVTRYQDQDRNHQRSPPARTPPPPLSPRFLRPAVPTSSVYTAASQSLAAASHPFAAGAFWPPLPGAGGPVPFYPISSLGLSSSSSGATPGPWVDPAMLHSSGLAHGPGSGSGSGFAYGGGAGAPPFYPAPVPFASHPWPPPGGALPWWEAPGLHGGGGGSWLLEWNITPQHPPFCWSRLDWSAKYHFPP